MPGIVTVVTPPASTQLALLDDVKLELQLTDDSQDAYLAKLIDRASAVIAGHCGRDFGAATLAETFRFTYDTISGSVYIDPLLPVGTASYRPLMLLRNPVIAVSDVTENGTDLVLGTDYEIDPLPGLIYRLSGTMRWRWNPPIVTVAYSAGWQLPNDTPATGVAPLPAQVADACLTLVRSAWFARGRDPNVAMDWTSGLSKVQFWDRSVSPMAIDDALGDQLSDFVSKGW